MSMGSHLIFMAVYEDNLNNLKEEIRLPAVPRPGETLTLIDAHYVVKDVFWQAHHPRETAPGYEWPDQMYYTLRVIVTRKFKEAN